MRLSKRRLAGVRRPGDRHHQAVAQSLAARGAGQRFRDLVAQARAAIQRRRHQILRHIGLVGKIDPRLDQRQRLDQPLAPGLGAIAEQALELAKRLAALRLGLGADQVGEAFDRGEVELAVLERAAGELAGLGRAQALRCAPSAASTAAITARPPCNCSSAMSSPVSLFGAGKPQRQRLVDRSRRCRGSRTRASARLARRGQVAGQRLAARRRRAARRCGPRQSPPAAGRRRGRRWCRLPGRSSRRTEAPPRWLVKA